MQLELSPGAGPELPSGFRYFEGFLPPEEEAAVRAELARLALGEVRMHGVVARRRVAHFGVAYAYGSRAVAPGAPLPAFLLPLRARAARLAAVADDDLAEALVTRYPAGSGIGWHRDAPAFGTVVGISLGAPARFRLRKGGAGGETRDLVVAPGSAYVIAGAARWAWQHMMPPVSAERWSVTFRTLRSARAR
jgi:DNA oxidative demethylase